MKPSSHPLTPVSFPLVALWVAALWIAIPWAPASAAEEPHSSETTDSETQQVEVPGVQLGELFPEVEASLESPDGAAVELAGQWGTEGLMVVFASNTCAYMVDWLDRFPRLAELAQTEGVGLVVVNSNARRRQRQESPEAMAILAAEQGWSFPYLVDRDATLAQALGAQRTPEVFLFDGGRRLVYRGAIDDHSGPWERVESHWALDALRQLVAGEGILTPSTQALGCAVQPPRKRRGSPSAEGGGASPD